MNVWLRVFAGLFGLLLQVVVLDAAIRTFLLPRVANVRLSRMVSKVVGRVFSLIARSSKSYPTKDQILSLYASIVLLTYQAAWLAISLVAFAFGFVAAGASSFALAFQMSGSSLFSSFFSSSRRALVLRCWLSSSPSFPPCTPPSNDANTPCRDLAFARAYPPPLGVFSR